MWRISRTRNKASAIRLNQSEITASDYYYDVSSVSILPFSVENIE
jgi:hypothetical protein